MSPATRAARLAAALLSAALLTTAAGCVGLPESGPVIETDGSTGTPVTSGVRYDPLPPLPDASRAEIVRGFLDAMTAVPIQTTSAAEFLTQEARSSWRPEQETITYGERSSAIDTGIEVSVRMLEGGNRFDSRGAWRGSLSGAELDLRFGLVMEQGEWRIAEAPDALVVPESWFEARYRRLSLSFFDPSMRILVPEPVFVADDALATRLVDGLLDGPDPELGAGSRTFFPTGTRLGDLSVPVSADGVADVSLSDVGKQPPESERLMLLQLAATLSQVTGVTSVRVTVDGTLVQQPGSDEGRFPVRLAERFDPAVPDASPIVFGVRDRVLVAGLPEALDPVSGPFGTGDVALRSVGVSLDGTIAAGVTAERRTALVAEVNGSPDSVRSILERGTDLLKPAWDVSDRIWLIDRQADGARVRYYENDRLRSLEVDGISGRRVRSFLISRDGSRLVAVVAGRAGDELVVSRIIHRAGGEVRSATPARVILGASGETSSIKDVAWQSPTSVAVLTGMAGELWEVRSVAVDGAPTSVESIANLNGPVRALAGSPVEGQSLLVLAPDEALDLSGPVAREIRFPDGQRPTSFDYAG